MKESICLIALFAFVGCAAAPQPKTQQVPPPSPQRVSEPAASALLVTEMAIDGAASFENLEPMQIEHTFKDKTITYTGVALEAVLRKVGVESGPGGRDGASSMDKRPGFKFVVIFDCADGFQAVFSVAELLEEIGPTRAHLVWQMDGKPLPDSEGPVRIIVTTDTRGARSARQVRRLRVLDLRKIDG